MTKNGKMYFSLTMLLLGQSAFASTLRTGEGAILAEVTCKNPKAEAVVDANLSDKAIREIRIVEGQALIFFSERGSNTVDRFPLSKFSTCKISAQL